MSIISWTSPRPSERILPASIDTSAPRSALCSRSSSPSSRTSWPRTGAGTVRQVANASCGGADDRRRPRAACATGSRASSPPVIGRAGDQVAVGGNRHAEPAQDLGRLGSSSECAGSCVGLWLVEVIRPCPSSCEAARRCWWPAGLQRDVLLRDEAGCRQPARRDQLDHRDGRRRRGPGDRAPDPAVDLAAAGRRARTACGSAGPARCRRRRGPAPPRPRAGTPRHRPPAAWRSTRISPASSRRSRRPSSSKKNRISSKWPG